MFNTPLTAAFMPLVPLASIGPDRIVEPDIDTPRTRITGDIDIIIFQENDAAAYGLFEEAKWTIWRMISLPPVSFGWALPAKMICTGRSGSLSNLARSLGVFQEQVTPLVGGEPPGESQSSRASGSKHLFGLPQARRGTGRDAASAPSTASARTQSTASLHR